MVNSFCWIQWTVGSCWSREVRCRHTAAPWRFPRPVIPHMHQESRKDLLLPQWGFLGEQGLVLFFMVIKGWDQNEDLGFCGFTTQQVPRYEVHEHFYGVSQVGDKKWEVGVWGLQSVSAQTSQVESDSIIHHWCLVTEICYVSLDWFWTQVSSPWGLQNGTMKWAESSIGYHQYCLELQRGQEVSR